MTHPSRNYSLSLFILALAVSVGCGVTVIDRDDSGKGGSPTGANDGGDASDCGSPPLDCIGGVYETDEEGCTICNYEITNCSQCQPSQTCVECNSAGPTFPSCVDTAVPDADQFQCKWVACARGDVCLDVQPAGDGCPDARCEPLPQECADDATCDCVNAVLGGQSCSTNTDGDMTVLRYGY